MRLRTPKLTPDSSKKHTITSPRIVRTLKVITSKETVGVARARKLVDVGQGEKIIART
jgi:hypothetical protein